MKKVSASILAVLVAGLTGCNGGSSDSSTESSTPSIALEPEIVAEEGEQVSVKADINIDDSYTLSFTYDPDIDLEPRVSNDRTAIILNIPNVSVETEFTLTLVADNGNNTLTGTTTVTVQDTLPDSQETYTTESQAGKVLTVKMDNFLQQVISSDFYLNGLIVSDAVVAAHSKKIEMIDYSISSSYIENLPPGRQWRIGTSKLYDMTVVQDDEDRVWLVHNSNFESQNEIQFRKTNPVLPSVVLWQTEGDNLIFQYAYLHNNTNFINALNRAYQATSDKKYTDIALKTAGELLKLLDDGVYRRQFLTEAAPVYTGMNQGIILESLYDLASLSQNKELYAEVKKIAGQYHHTTEGVWNHYTNSVIGGLIAEDLNLYKDIDINNDINSKIPQLINEIERLNGQIPYFMNRFDDRYLDLSPTYHTYDFMLQAKLARYTDDRLNLNRVLDKVIDQIEVNYGSFYANNTEALLYAYQGSRYVNAGFSNNQWNMINKETTALVDHISYLRAATALLMLHEHTDHPSFN